MGFTIHYLMHDPYTNGEINLNFKTCSWIKGLSKTFWEKVLSKNLIFKAHVCSKANAYNKIGKLKT